MGGYPKGKTYSCNRCGFIFTRRDHLRRHLGFMPSRPASCNPRRKLFGANAVQHMRDYLTVHTDYIYSEEE